MSTMLLRKIAVGSKEGLKPVKMGDSVFPTSSKSEPVERAPRLEPGYNGGGLADSWKLYKLDDAVRAVTINPLIRSLLAGGLLAGGTWLAGPAIGRVSRDVFGMPQQHDEYGRPVDITSKDRKWLTGIAGGLGFLASALPSLDTRRPFWGLMSYYPKRTAFYESTPYLTENRPAYPMQRTASAGFYGRDELIPLSMAKEGILANPRLNMEMKSRSLDLLNSFQTQNQEVSSNDLVNKAVNSGISGLTGYAVGYLTSSVLGLGKPSQVAPRVGIMSAIKSLF